MISKFVDLAVKVTHVPTNESIVLERTRPVSQQSLIQQATTVVKSRVFSRQLDLDEHEFVYDLDEPYPDDLLKYRHEN